MRELTRWIQTMMVRNAEGTVVDQQHFIATFTASRHIEGAQVEEVYNRMQQCIEEALYKSGNWARINCKTLVKDITLAMQGSWMTRHCMTWRCIESTSRGDAPAIVHRERKVEGRTDGWHGEVHDTVRDLHQ